MVFLSVNEHLLRILRLGWRGKLKWVRDRLQGADEAGRGVRAPRGRARARRKARGRFGFSRFARGDGLFAFNARFGTVPLPLGAFGDRLTKECSGDRLLGCSEAGWAGLFGGLRETVPFLG